VSSFRSRTCSIFLHSVAALGLILIMGPLAAQDTTDSDTEEESAVEEIVVTGSRIRRSPVDNVAPTGIIGSEIFNERGYTSAAQALNDFTSNSPALNQAPGNGDSSGSGQQFPNLFGLGTGRTLTLVNGHRFVTSSVGLGDAQVDANIMPTGLIERIDIVQAGGAAVYGSDAIAGVVNYVLRDDFEGIELDAQYGQSSRNDYEEPDFRLTAGMNFDDNRGNVAVNVEYAKSPQLFFSDRPLSNLSRITQGNPADTGPNDGIPSVQEILDAHFWEFNENGVIYNIPAPFAFALTQVNGTPSQFDSNGNIVPYDPGEILGIPFAKGGDGFRYSELAGLRTGVERFNTTLIGHYDITDRITLRGEFLYSSTKGDEVPQGFTKTVLSPAPFNPVMIFNFNPFLSPEAVATLSAASPQFAGGGPLWLSRHFYYDLLPSNVQSNDTETLFGFLGLEGDFDAASRNWYWSVFASLGHVDGEIRVWDVDNAKFANAIFAIPGPNGPACLINFDGNPNNDDAACAPINPFGFGNISQEASEYVSVMTGQDYTNKQFDFLASIGTSLFTLPGGDLDAVFAYEHRYEDADFVPLPANQAGITGVGAMEVPQSGSYHTNELSAEVLIPIIGGDIARPGFEAVELNGSYRWVDNSIAGTESVWSLGLRWQLVQDLTLRATYSRNFRAPTLTQLVAPQSTSASSVGPDPCDADRISGGPNPDVRLANCQAEWDANPQYGDLADFQDPAENFIVAQVTTGGNPDLRNETSDTTTYGLVLQPRFLPGFTFSVDRIEIDLTDGLSAFEPTDFMATCYDSTPQPMEVCDTFQRLSEAEGNNPAGTVITALSTTFNAGVVDYRGEYYFLDYQLPLDDWFGSTPNRLSFTVNATHTSKYEVSVTGTSFIRYDNTVTQPDWTTNLTIRYGYGPFSMSYQLFYLSRVLAAPNATIENNPNPVIDSNTTHSLSAQYDWRNFSFRAGVVNLTDKDPSYPQIAYGDILGRRWFVGATARF